MNETEISIKVKVFSDPEYCMEHDHSSQCEHLVPTFNNEPFCTIFAEKLNIHTSEGCVPHPLKCTKCKEALKQANK